MRTKKIGKQIVSSEAVIYWIKEFEGRPPKMVGFSISLIATELEGQPCVWRADTAHGHAHEHQEWNNLLIPLTERRESNYQKTYETCLNKILNNYERYLQLFKESLEKWDE